MLSTKATRPWVFVMIVVAVAATLYLVPPEYHLGRLLQWSSGGGIVGGTILVIGFVIASVVFFPESILTLAAGAIFGLVGGTIVAVIGSSAAIVISFWIGRTVGRGWVESRLEDNRHFLALDQAVAQRGFQIVLLTRLVLLLPFSFLNYAYSVSRVSTRDYVLGSIFGTVLPTILYVYVGSTALTVAELIQRGPRYGTLEAIISGVGLLLTIAVTYYVVRTARRTLAEVVDLPVEA